MITSESERKGWSRHESKDDPRYAGSEHRHSLRSAGRGRSVSKLGWDGETMMRLRNRWRWSELFYCLCCHPELGRRPEILKGRGG
jgi:hypothetical protein